MADSIGLSLFASRVAAICDEMGAMLGRTAFSPNIRDRLDYSCALFDPAGRLLGQATHIPVHLGSMAYAMRGIVESHEWRPGDILVLNDPFRGGTHLPDVTLVAPVFFEAELAGFSANRAHHADIGADSPGSMPLSRSLEEEGVLIPPSMLVRAGIPDEHLMEKILGRLSRPAVSRGDFSAQMAAARLGVRRLLEFVSQSGPARFRHQCADLQSHAQRLSAASLQKLPIGRFQFTDVLDDDGQVTGKVPIRVLLDLKGESVRVDFSGTAKQVAGNLNCPLPVTAAAVFYVFRCLMPDHIPACHGAMDGIQISVPEGSLLNARSPAAVAAGNVETSMRIVDAVCGALAQALPEHIPAASQGTMNNLAMGARGVNGWDYYETLAGGCGAGPDCDGRSARHSHMTNTLNTPVEVLEQNYPLRVERYEIRRNSGGTGRWRGGDGITRRYRFLSDAQVSLLTERRIQRPWGLAGGGKGKAGKNLLDGQALTGKCQFSVQRGQGLEICTPGGGGFRSGPEIPDPLCNVRARARSESSSD
jgi:N-methylhydantoinase B